MKLAVAITFVWLGMVVAISFLEAPLKFHAEGVTLRIGLSIGRLVFRALNAVEAILAIVVVASLATGSLPVRVVVPLALAVAALVLQLLAVRPSLTRRSTAVLAGEDAPLSRAHYAYVALETVKTFALLVGGILLLVT